jgi:hypothetical protein
VDLLAILLRMKKVGLERIVMEVVGFGQTGMDGNEGGRFLLDWKGL